MQPGASAMTCLFEAGSSDSCPRPPLPPRPRPRRRDAHLSVPVPAAVLSAAPVATWKCFTKESLLSLV